MSEGARKLSEEELFQCLKSLNVPVRLSDLKTPTRDFMIRVFECFLKDLQIDIKSINLRPWEIEKHIENPEISEDARMLMLLTISINFFTSPDGLVINLNDITQPKPKRTKKILNYLIVFWNYCVTNYALVESIDEGLQEEKEKINDLVKENEDLENHYNDCALIFENLQPSQEELNQHVDLINTQIEECRKQKDIDTVKYQDLKKKEQDLRTQIATADVNIVSVKEAIHELEQCIVSSPDRFSTEINKLKDLIKNEELKIKEKESDLKEKSKKLEGVKLSQEDNRKAMELLQKVEESCVEFSNLANTLVLESHKGKDQDKIIERLDEELLKKKENTYLYEGKSVQVQLNIKMEMDTFKETLQTLQKDFSEEQQLLESTKNSISELKEEIDKAADCVIEVVHFCKQAEVESEKAHVAYKAQMEAISNEYRKDCSKVKENVKLFFGAQ